MNLSGFSAALSADDVIQELEEQLAEALPMKEILRSYFSQTEEKVRTVVSSLEAMATRYDPGRNNIIESL